MGAHLRSGCTLPHALRAPCRRNPSAARPVVTKAAAVEEEFVRCVKGERLREWVLENGGVVHPSLAVVEATRKTGSRGVVALQPISVETSASEPLVLVPESLYLTSQVSAGSPGFLSDATRAQRRVESSRALELLEMLQETLQVAWRIGCMASLLPDSAIGMYRQWTSKMHGEYDGLPLYPEP
jgi:hypothetical protein